MQQAMYPVQFSVDYPDRALDRLTTFFRLFMAIPIAIVLGAVAGGTWQWTNGRTAAFAAGAGGLLHRSPVRAPGLCLPRRGARSQPVAASGEMVPGHPTLHRAVLPAHRDGRGGDHRLVRHPVHRALPQGDVRFRGGRHPLGQPGHRLRGRPGHRPVPAVSAEPVRYRLFFMNSSIGNGLPCPGYAACSLSLTSPFMRSILLLFKSPAQSAIYADC